MRIYRQFDFSSLIPVLIIRFPSTRRMHLGDWQSVGKPARSSLNRPRQSMSLKPPSANSTLLVMPMLLRSLLERRSLATLSCVEAGFVRIMLKVGSEALQRSDIQTKDGSRIWLDVYLRDLSGGVTCKMGQDVALALTECADSDAFLQHLLKGRTCLPMRSYKVLVSHSTVDNAVYANLNGFHAGAPTLPSFSQPEYTNPHGLMVAEIRHLAKNQCGNMIHGIKEMPVLAEVVLAVLQGTNDAECQWRGKSYMFVSRWFRTLSARQTLRDFKL